MKDKWTEEEIKRFEEVTYLRYSNGYECDKDFKNFTVAGQIVWTSNGEEMVLGFVDRYFCVHILAETWRSIVGYHTTQCTVRFAFDDKWVEDIDTIAADVANSFFYEKEKPKADYGKAYSEIIGYLWTTEEFKIGGHDLLPRFTLNLGKFFKMEVTRHRERK